MARTIAIVLTAWTGLRWVGFLLGLARIRHFSGDAQGEARRAVVVRAATTLLLSIGALYAWAVSLRLQPTDDFVGLLAAVAIVALSVAAALSFMQPRERTPETVDVCRIGWTRADAAAGPTPKPGTTPEPDATAGRDAGSD